MILKIEDEFSKFVNFDSEVDSYSVARPLGTHLVCVLDFSDEGDFKPEARGLYLSIHKMRQRDEFERRKAEETFGPLLRGRMPTIGDVWLGRVPPTELTHKPVHSIDVFKCVNGQLRITEYDRK